MSSSKLITRLAPTPSGFIHAGNAFNFILTALIAHREGADILLRIDDLDQERYRKEYADDIFHVLSLLGIEWQMGPESTTDLEEEWSQVHRMDLFHEALSQLKEGGHLFACQCSRTDVETNSYDEGYPGTCRELGLDFEGDVAWRLRTDDEEVEVHTWQKGIQKVKLPTSMRDFVVRRRDGIPAYQLASVVDDAHFGVNLVVRGQDLWDSTIAQLYLSRKLQAASHRTYSSIKGEIQFLHHPLLTHSDGKKISKSTKITGPIISNAADVEEIYRNFSKWAGVEEVKDLGGLKRVVMNEGVAFASLLK